MDFDKLVKKRKSVRSYLDKPLENEKIKQIIDAARQAPSSCNEQLWHFIIITDQKIKEKLVKEAGTATIIKNAPAAAAVYYHMKNEELGWQSAAAAIMSVLFKATDMEVGSLWLSAVGKRSKVDEILKTPAGLKLVAFVLLGYEKGETRSTTRKPLDEIMHMNGFSGQRFEFRHNPKYWTIEKIGQWQRSYCGKTSPGVHLDIVNKEEINRIKKHISGNVVDFFSYDGSYEKAMPEKFTALNLSEETNNYLKKATKKETETIVFNGQKLPFENETLENITIIHKLERIPKKNWKPLFEEIHRTLKKNGKLVIAYRNKKSIYQLFHMLSIKLLGDDITKTAIHSYFGPFHPICNVEQHLIGFTTKTTNYYLAAPVFKQYLQLVFQYHKSGGTTYLHRTKTDNILTRVFGAIIDLLKHIPLFPCTKVIEAKKK